MAGDGASPCSTKQKREQTPLRGAVFSVLAVLVLLSCQPGEAPLPIEQPQGQEQAEQFLDLTAIAGNSPGEVEQVLGTPTFREETKVAGRSYPRNLYREGEVEVIFVV